MKDQALWPLPDDERDFVYSQVYDLPALKDIPLTDWLVAEPLKIKDQKTTDFCAAFSSTAVSEDQEGIELSPEWQFSQIKRLLGDPDPFGADLRTTCKSHRHIGSIPQELAPYTVENKDRDFLANWKNWPADLDDKAIKYAKRSFFRADIGPYDRFDNIRAALWANRKYKRTIVSGAMWYYEWTRAKGGVVPTKYSKESGPHAFKILGQKMINGEPYLVIQNSWGKDRGDNGLFYFSRETVNKAFTYGNFMFVDADPEYIKRLIEGKVGLLEQVINLLKELIITYRKYGLEAALMRCGLTL